MEVSRRWSTAIKWTATVLFAGHMFSTCVQQIPIDSALHPLEKLFVAYQAITGTWQTWDMFVTIPYLHAYDVRLDVTEPDGTTSTAGAELPGLHPYDGDTRPEAFFTRVLDEKSFAGYLAAYERRICAALRDERGHGGQTVVIHETFENIRSVADIRAGGPIGKRDEHLTKVTCE
jgi:hypothetical protein